MNPSLPPRFHELDEYTFQDLCCDLFAEEESLASCDAYGVRGQTQLGIDLLAPRRDGDGNEVAQCKCCEALSVGDIDKASDKFLEHLDHWTERKVRRFVLIAACPLERAQQQEAVQRQRTRFAQHGIAYEAWSARTLRQKLAPHRAIAERHINSRDMVDNVCGPRPGDVVELPAGGAHLVIALETAGSQIVRLSSAVSREKAARLEEARTLLRRGQRTTAYAAIRAIRDDSTWSALENPLRARVLRVLASCVLDMEGDLIRARALTDEAHTLDPSANDAVLRAVIRYHESGPKAALDGLPTAEDVDTLNYRLGLLLELGEPETLLGNFEERSATITANAETLRLHALALITRKDLAAARKAVEQAIADEPDWEGVRMAAGIVDYYSALSATAVPDRLLPIPGPVPWEFVKRDDDSLAFLRSAEDRFRSLAANAERPTDWRRVFSTWRLACLANDPNRQAEASDLCRALLSENPGDPYVLMWALVRGYDVDVAAASRAIERNQLQNADAAAILVALNLSRGDVDAALELLDRVKDVFVRAGLLDRWLFLRVRALVERQDTEGAFVVASTADDPAAGRELRLVALHGNFERTGEWQELLKHLELSFDETGDPRFLYESCSLKARLEDWPYVADRAEKLVTAIGTASAVRLARIIRKLAGKKPSPPLQTCY